ncbi:MerR family transcriptional regulator [Paenibacillus soyae]|uniref:MerR family transcriptional regulator n=1 Tax=Paenibacillus soyae TaxID=2969249 RepID=A0A9X2MIC3_9BACL|nr:MerR family transcriptional regulator [Paenibacillus soyae]MCR2802303.1 MerR family transcriptional regulator [Paenibacillus soyae]
MKDSFKINEISKLYGIGPDSLRYYEKLGVLKPRRDTNGYRLYGLQDLYKLNIIRDLRSLDFSMQQIKEYLDNQNVGNTIDRLLEEQRVIERQLEKLQAKQRIIQGRIRVLTEAAHIQDGVITVKALSDRPCLQLKTLITRDEEMDLAIKRLHRKHEHRLDDFGNLLIGAFVSVEDLRKGVKDVFHSVFFIMENGTKEYDFLLPAGQYLSLYYRGDYRQSSDRIREVLAFASEHGYRVAGGPFEIYEVDNRDTMKSEEFLTEIQVRVEVVPSS